MARVIIEYVLTFLSPFALYALYLALARAFSPEDPTPQARWHGKVLAGLTLIGLGLCIASVIFVGFTAERARGPYVPAHMDNGRLIPGRFQ